MFDFERVDFFFVFSEVVRVEAGKMAETAVGEEEEEADDSMEEEEDEEDDDVVEEDTENILPQVKSISESVLIPCCGSGFALDPHFCSPWILIRN